MKKTTIIMCVLVITSVFALGAKRTRTLTLEDRVRNLERMVSVLGSRIKILERSTAKRLTSLDNRVNWLEDNCCVLIRKQK